MVLTLLPYDPSPLRSTQNLAPPFSLFLPPPGLIIHGSLPSILYRCPWPVQNLTTRDLGLQA